MYFDTPIYDLQVSNYSENMLFWETLGQNFRSRHTILKPHMSYKLHKLASFCKMICGFIDFPPLDMEDLISLTIFT